MKTSAVTGKIIVCLVGLEGKTILLADSTLKSSPDAPDLEESKLNCQDVRRKSRRA